MSNMPVLNDNHFQRRLSSVGQKQRSGSGMQALLYPTSISSKLRRNGQTSARYLKDNRDYLRDLEVKVQTKRRLEEQKKEEKETMYMRRLKSQSQARRMETDEMHEVLKRCQSNASQYNNMMNNDFVEEQVNYYGADNYIDSNNFNADLNYDDHYYNQQIQNNNNNIHFNNNNYSDYNHAPPANHAPLVNHSSNNSRPFQNIASNIPVSSRPPTSKIDTIPFIPAGFELLSEVSRLDAIQHVDRQILAAEQEMRFHQSLSKRRDSLKLLEELRDARNIFNQKYVLVPSSKSSNINNSNINNSSSNVNNSIHNINNNNSNSRIGSNHVDNYNSNIKVSNKNHSNVNKGSSSNNKIAIEQFAESNYHHSQHQFELAHNVQKTYNHNPSNNNSSNNNSSNNNSSSNLVGINASSETKGNKKEEDEETKKLKRELFEKRKLMRMRPSLRKKLNMDDPLSCNNTSARPVSAKAKQPRQSILQMKQENKSRTNNNLSARSFNINSNNSNNSNNNITQNKVNKTNNNKTSYNNGSNNKNSNNIASNNAIHKGFVKSSKSNDQDKTVSQKIEHQKVHHRPQYIASSSTCPSTNHAQDNGFSIFYSTQNVYETFAYSDDDDDAHFNLHENASYLAENYAYEDDEVNDENAFVHQDYHEYQNYQPQQQPQQPQIQQQIQQQYHDDQEHSELDEEEFDEEEFDDNDEEYGEEFDDGEEYEQHEEEYEEEHEEEYEEEEYGEKSYPYEYEYDHENSELNGSILYQTGVSQDDDQY